MNLRPPGYEPDELPAALLRVMVGRGGFEPPKAVPTDLQSAPFGHSGTSPYSVMRVGADDGTRTRNLLITNQLLYQLSYIGTACDDYYIISPGPMSRSFPPHFPPLFGRLSSGAGTLAIWRAGPYNIS